MKFSFLTHSTSIADLPGTLLEPASAVPLFGATGPSGLPSGVIGSLAQVLQKTEALVRHTDEPLVLVPKFASKH